MDAVPDLITEHVVDESVLGEPGQAGKGPGGHDGVEVVAITRDVGHGARDAGLDAGLELVWCSWHLIKATEAPALHFLKHDHSH